MTTVASGPISLLSLQTEFGGVNPISMSEYYRGGTSVINLPLHNSIPISGPISMANFYNQTYLPAFAVRRIFNGTVTQNSTTDLSSYMTLPTSNLITMQRYDAPGGGETFYTPPVTKLNGINMTSLVAQYTNAYDDGNAMVISTSVVPAGSPAVVTWTSSASCTGTAYEVIGFRDLAAAKYSSGTCQNLTSGNSPAPRTLTLPTTATCKVLYFTYGGISTTDITGKLDLFDISGGLYGWDYNPDITSTDYYGGNRLSVGVAFETLLA